MADMYKFEDLLDRAYGMEIIRDSSKTTATINITGVDWFTYADVVVNKIYLTNNAIGFGTYSTKQLNMCKRGNDGAVYSAYRQEGILTSGDRFLKIRVEGYTTNTNSPGDFCTLIYELFLIEGQKLFINVIKLPTNSSYIGTSTITNGSSQIRFSLSSTSAVPVSILVENAGTSDHKVSYTKYTDVALTGLEIASLPTKTTYHRNDIFDKTGLRVNAIREDEKNFQISNFNISGFNAESAGVKSISVSYENVSTTFEITVLETQLTGILAAPNKAEYQFYENLSPDDVVLIGTLATGETAALSSNIAAYSGFKKGVSGKQTITVVYGEFSTSFDITVKAPNIDELLGTKNGMTYVLNNQLRNGYVISVNGVNWFKYGIRTTDIVYVASNGWIGFGRPKEHLSLFQYSYLIEKSSIYSVLRQEGVLESGKRFLKIRVEGYVYKNNTYSDYFYTYEVFLIEGQTIFVYVPKLPENVLYGYDNFGLSYAYDEHNKTYIPDIKTVKNGGVEPVSILIENAGTCQHVSSERYTDKIYTGIEISNLPNKTIYMLGEEFDASGMVVNAIDSGGNKTPITNYSVKGFDAEAGEKKLSVIYQGLEATLNVTINNKDSLKITKLPNKTTYAVDDEFVSDGLEVTFCKADGTKEIVTSSCTLSNPNMSITGRQVIIVTYMDYTVLFYVDIGSCIKAAYTTFKKRVAFDRGIIGADGKLSVNKNAREIIVPKGVTGVVKNTYDVNFAACQELVSIYLPSTLQKLGTQSFRNNLSLIDMGLPPSLISAGQGCFSQVSAKEMWIQNFTKLESSAFYNWLFVTRIYLSSTITEIGYACFGYARSLKELVIPKSVVTIYTHSLMYLTVLQKIYFMNPSLENIVLTAVEGLTIYGFAGSTAETYANKNGINFIALGEFSSLELDVKPKKLKYKIGDIFDICGIDLRAVYSSGERVSVPPDSISGFDSTTEGTKTIILTYENATVSFDVEVVSATGIEITSLPVRTVFQKDEDFEEEGLVVSEIYNDGTKSEIKGFTLSGYDSSIVGKQTVTASYDSMQASFQVETTLDDALIGITILNLPDKIKYSPGDTFSSDGLQVGFVYSDGSTVPITSSSTISKPDMATIGTQTVTVSHNDYKQNDGTTVTYAATFEIIIEETVIDIEVNERYGNNDCFFIGDTNTGNYRYAVKSIKATYENGSSRIITSGFTETEVDTSKAGSFYTVTSYGGKEVQSPYTVYGSPFVTPTGYEQKNAATLTLDLDTGEGIVEGTGSLGYPNNVPSSFSDKIKTLEIKEGITGISRFRYCRITYIGIPSTVTSLTDKSFSFLSTTTNIVLRINAKKDSIPNAPWGLSNATIIWAAKPQSLSIEQLPTQIKYMVGDTFDPTGTECSVVYSNDKTYLISEGLSYSSVDTSEPGKQLVTVSYTEDETTLSAKFGIEVVSKIAGIRISSFPSKIYYKIGESLDLSGLEVVTIDGAGNENTLTDYEVTGFDSSDAGTKTVTVFYNTEINGVNTFVGSDSFQIRVTKDGANPFTNGDVEVTVHWINGEFEDLTNDHIDLSSFNLRESICDENYFIFGGCICNQLSFRAHHEQFDSTEEEFYPQGKIEVYLECNGTSVKVFTGEIDSAEREADSMTRDFVAYDGLYKLKNTDIAWWYKNQTTDKNKLLTQKEFRDKLFEFLGIEQVPTTLHWDNAYVPNTNNANEIIVINVLKDLCLQNDRFGHMNRDGRFEYLKLRQNSYKYGETVQNKPIYKYYNNEEIHLDTFKSFTAKEGRIWFPHTVFADPEPDRAYGFTQGEPTAQEAYENNVYYNRNSFFVGNEDWMDYVWNADEYGQIKRSKPIMDICYGMFINLDLRKYYRAQGYTAEVEGNPLNTVGQAVELYHTREVLQEDGTYKELKWYVHSYIMTRTLQLGATGLIDTYSAKNAPFNSNSRQLGTNTPEVTATVNKTRTELPTISYAEFTDTDGSDFSAQALTDILRKANLRCIKYIDKSKYEDLVTAGMDRADTLYFTHEKSSKEKSSEQKSSEESSS